MTSFLKNKSCSGTVNRTSVYAEAAVQMVLSKKCHEKFCRIHKKTPYEFCEISKNTFFAEHHRATAPDYSSINSSEGRIGKPNCKL